MKHFKAGKSRWFCSRASFIIAALLVMIMAGGELYAGDGGVFAKEFAPTLERAKEYSIKMAELMPENHYSFKPTPEIMSFAEQTVHTATAMYWFASKVKGEDNPGKDFKAEGKSKAEIITFLKASFDYAIKVLSGLSDEEAAKKVPLFGDVVLTKAQIMLALWDHTTHHRGGMVIYLRLKGIKPTQYVGW